MPHRAASIMPAGVAEITTSVDCAERNGPLSFFHQRIRGSSILRISVEVAVFHDATGEVHPHRPCSGRHTCSRCGGEEAAGALTAAAPLGAASSRRRTRSLTASSPPSAAPRLRPADLRQGACLQEGGELRGMRKDDARAACPPLGWPVGTASGRRLTPPLSPLLSSASPFLLCTPAHAAARALLWHTAGPHRARALGHALR